MQLLSIINKGSDHYFVKVLSSCDLPVLVFLGLFPMYWCDQSVILWNEKESNRLPRLLPNRLLLWDHHAVPRCWKQSVGENFHHVCNVYQDAAFNGNCRYPALFLGADLQTSQVILE